MGNLLTLYTTIDLHMASITFYLDHPRSNGRLKKNPVPLYVFVTRKGKPRLQVNTDKRVLPAAWDFSKSKWKPQATNSIKLNRWLSNLRVSVEDICLKYPNEGSDSIKFRIREMLGLTPEEKTLLQVFDDFIRFKQQKVKRITVNKYMTTRNHLQDFYKQSGEHQTFDNTGMRFFDKLLDHLYGLPGRKRDGEHEPIKNDTVHLYVRNLREFMEWSLDREYHTNKTFQKWEWKRPVDVDHPVHEPDELHKLVNADLSGRLDRVRDLYVFACFTGQRWSDITGFDKKQLEGSIWKLRQRKGDLNHTTKVDIPLLGHLSPAMNILRKYDFKLPQISEQKFNNYIKEVGKEIGIDREFTLEQISRNKRISTTGPLYKFMSAHMARRTCATMLLENNVPLTTVMKICGWKRAQTAMKYVKVSTESIERALTNTSPILSIAK